jgi:hypothetical protein
VNFNLLAPSDPESLERLAGLAHLTGIPVRVARAARIEGNGSVSARESTPASPEELPAAQV